MSFFQNYFKFSEGNKNVIYHQLSTWFTKKRKFYQISLGVYLKMRYNLIYNSNYHLEYNNAVVVEPLFKYHQLNL